MNLKLRGVSRIRATYCFALLSVTLFAGCETKVKGPETTAAPLSPASGLDHSTNANLNSDAALSPKAPLSDVSNLVDLDLPVSKAALESLVNQRVAIRNTMVVVDTYNLAKSGQVTLAADDRIFAPTNSIDPNDADPDGVHVTGADNAAEIHAAVERNQSATIILDDGSASKDPRPVPNLEIADGVLQSLRVGSRIENLSGVIKKSDGRFYLIPDHSVAISRAERPDRPDLADANFVVASSNVLNFFSTIDDGTNQARGADSEMEFLRQRNKLVAALLAMDADVTGLIELENNLESERVLVSALNEQFGSEVFAGVGLPDDFATAPGGDNAIRVGIIYRRDRVTPVGRVGMISHEAFANARTPLFQRFRRNSGADSIRVVVNHFKSKGRGKAKGADLDQNDGQSAYNDSRRKQASAIMQYVRTQTAFDKSSKFLIVGDLNAYQQEDPIDILRAGGLIDLIGRHAGSSELYSYIYYGQSGLLDHAFGTQNLADQVTAAVVWHVNCDEPRCFDYNQEFNPQDAFQPDMFRFSDHDPLLVGMKLD